LLLYREKWVEDLPYSSMRDSNAELKELNRKVAAALSDSAENRL